MQKPKWMRVIAFSIQSWLNDGLGVAGCQRLKHKCTSLGNRNLGYLNELIAVEPTVPRLRDAVDPLSMLERVVALGIVRVDLLPRRQEKDLRKVLVCRKPRAQLALAQGCEAIEPIQRIEDASIKEDMAGGRSVTNIVVDVQAQRFMHERIRIRSRTQPVPEAILDDGARAIADDGVATRPQRQQECGLASSGATGHHYSRHAQMPPWVLSMPNVSGLQLRWRSLP